MAEIEDRWRELGEFIREQRGQLSLRKVSEMAGISNPYLSQIERGLRKPSAEILRQIAGALSISAETLYVRAGILDEPDGAHDLEAAISRDPFLDEEHKKTLLHIYRSFRTAYLAAHGGAALPADADADADAREPADATAADPTAAVDQVELAEPVDGGPGAASTGELVATADEPVGEAADEPATAASAPAPAEVGAVAEDDAER